MLRSCGGYKNPLSQKEGPAFYVPLEATVILSFDLDEITKEIDFDTLSKSNDYIKLLSSYYTQNPPFTMVFRDPEGSGIDLDQNAMFYLDVGDKKGDTYTASILPLKSEEQFSDMITKTKLKLKSQGGYKYAVIDPASSIAWINNMAVFITTNDSFKKTQLLNKIFSTKRQKYYDQHLDYQQFIESNQGDVLYWIDLSSYARNQILATAKEGEFSPLILSGNYIYGDLDFKNGQLDLTSNFKFNSIIKGVLDNLIEKHTDLSVFDKMPLSDPSFLGCISLDIDGMFASLLKSVELKLEARNSLVKYGLVIEDFGKAFTGDVILGSFAGDSEFNSLLFGLKIKDITHFNTIINVMIEMGQIEVMEPNIYKMPSSYLAFLPLNSTFSDGFQRMVVKDNYMFVSLDNAIIENILNDKNYQYSELLLSKEPQSISAFGNTDFRPLTNYSQQFSIRNYRLNFNGDKLNLELKLKDAQKSSLKQLLKLD